MLKAVFYARFHPVRGSAVIHQYPNGSIVPAADDSSQEKATTRVLTFQDISGYIIPPYEVCDRSFSVASNGYRVLGFPVSLEDPKYERNRFTYNVCFVLQEDQNAHPWQQLVRKTALFFKRMELEDGLLQFEEKLEGLKWAGEPGYPSAQIGVIYSLLKGLHEQLNTYIECCIRGSDFHVLNLRLSPPKKPPRKVRSWDVPLLIRSILNPNEWAWDLTLRCMHPHINGVNHVQRLAELADVELKVAKRCISELVVHERVMLLDIFHFQATYMPTADLAWFVHDAEMLDECRRYIAVDPSKSFFGSRGVGIKPTSEVPYLLTRAAIVELYSSLKPGLTLYDFCLAHQAQLAIIDIRRFITFGVIKGFLRRVHKYAIAIDQPPPDAKSAPKHPSPKNSDEDAIRAFDKAWKKAALSSGWATPPVKVPANPVRSSNGSRKDTSTNAIDDEKIRKYSNGQHCLDQICVEMHESQSNLVENLSGGRFGEVVYFDR